MEMGNLRIETSTVAGISYRKVLLIVVQHLRRPHAWAFELKSWRRA